MKLQPFEQQDVKKKRSGKNEHPLKKCGCDKKNEGTCDVGNGKGKE